MSLSANTVMEVRQGGDDTNGGGFVTGASGTDYSQQDSAQLSLTDLATSGAVTTLTSSTGGFTSAMIGNLIYIASGTNFDAGFYEITGHTDTNTVTLDRTPSSGGAGSGGSGKVGGALGTPGMLTDVPWTNGMKAWVKHNATAYLMTTTVAGAAGPCDITANGGAKQIVVEGYETTRGDLGAKPVYDVGTQTNVSVYEIAGQFGNKHHILKNLKVDGQDNSGVIGFDSSATTYLAISHFEFCEAVDCPIGFQCSVTNQGHSTIACRCKADSCGDAGFLNLTTQHCYAKSCADGFRTNNTTKITFYRDVAHACTIGFQSESSSLDKTYIGCIAYKCTADGWDMTNYDMFVFQECISYGNSGYGWDFHASNLAMHFKNCAGGSNTSGNFDDEPTFNDDFVTLTADPFTDGDNGDFTINDTAGGGTLLRAETLTLPI